VVGSKLLNSSSPSAEAQEGGRLQYARKRPQPRTERVNVAAMELAAACRMHDLTAPPPLNMSQRPIGANLMPVMGACHRKMDGGVPIRIGISSPV